MAFVDLPAIVMIAQATRCSSMQSECAVYSSEKENHMTWLPTTQTGLYHERQLFTTIANIIVIILVDVHLHLSYYYGK